MGIVTSSTGNYIWFTVTNGQMKYRLNKNDEPQFCNGYIGVIRGVRVKEKTFGDATYTVIDVLMQDDTDGVTKVIVTGTLFADGGTPTVYGKMLLARLAHPDLRERKGVPVKLTVWTPKDAATPYTCCTFRDAATDDKLGYLDLKDIPEGEIRSLLERMALNAVEYYGAIPTGHTAGASHEAAQTTDEPEGAGIDGGAGDDPFVTGGTDLPF